MRARPGSPPRPTTHPAGAVLVVLGLLLAGAAPAHAERVPPPSPVVGEPLEDAPVPPEVTAEAWVLMDAETGQVLAEQRGEQRRPVASTIKVLTALSVLDRADPEDVVVVGEEVAGVAGASVGLAPGDHWTVEQLLDGLLLRSGNDAAEALAVHVAGDMDAFVEQMAADAAALGLDEVVLTEASGLGDGNELSARDLATIARTALADPDLRPLLGRERAQLPGLGTVVTRNELLGDYPGATGVKTGYTAAAGFSLIASARRDGRELIAVVLASEEDPARFVDTARLLDHGFEAFEPAVVELDRRLLVGGGQLPVVAPPTPLVVPTATPARLAPDPPVRASTGPLLLEVLVDDQRVGSVAAEVGAPPPPVSGTAGLGRALAGEVHAAMRAGSAEGRW